METQESFSVLLLTSQKEGIRDTKASNYEQEMIDETQNMESNEINGLKEKTPKVEDIPKAVKKLRKVSVGRSQVSVKGELTPKVETEGELMILGTKTQTPKVETEGEFPQPQLFLECEGKFAASEPEDFFEADPKLKAVSNNLVEIARSKSCKHGTSKTMVCPECGINVHKCQMCKSTHKTFHRNQTLTVCTECGIDVTVKYLNRHMKKYHKAKRVCEFSGCEYSSIYRRLLRSHFDRIHLNIPTPKNAICTECGKGFTDAFRLKNHVIADHLKLRPYKCKQCDKSFGRNKHLWSHMDVHKASDAYTCSICGRGFRNNGAFFNHKKLHTRGIVELAGSPRHLEVAQGSSKGIRCGGCILEVVVSSLEEMEEHMATLHPTTGAFWCDQCNYSFLDEETLTSHNKKYHASQGAKKRRYGSKEAEPEDAKDVITCQRRM